MSPGEVVTWWVLCTIGSCETYLIVLLALGYMIERMAMPTPERANRYQTALLFTRSGIDEYGRHTVSSPSEIKVRWDWNRRDVRRQDGTTITVEATALVGQVIAVGSQMWLGELDSWVGTGSSGDDTDLMEVVGYREVHDIKGRIATRTIDLARFMDQPSQS